MRRRYELKMKLSSWLVWLYVGVAAGVSSQGNMIRFGDVESKPGQPEYYLMVDADTPHVGPSDELKRSQRSFWKKLWKRTGLHDLFNDDDCSDNNYYNAGNDNYYTAPPPSPPPYDPSAFSYQPFQPIQAFHPLRVFHPLFRNPFGAFGNGIGGQGGGGGGYSSRGGNKGYAGDGAGGYVPSNGRLEGYGRPNDGVGKGYGGPNNGGVGKNYGGTNSGTAGGGYGGQNIDNAARGYGRPISGGASGGYGKPSDGGVNRGYERPSGASEKNGVQYGKGEDAGGYGDYSVGPSGGGDKGYSGNGYSTGVGGGDGYGGNIVEYDEGNSGGSKQPNYNDNKRKDDIDFNPIPGAGESEYIAPTAPTYEDPGIESAKSEEYTPEGGGSDTNVPEQSPYIPESAGGSSLIRNHAGEPAKQTYPNIPASGYSSEAQPQILYQPIIYVSPQYSAQKTGYSEKPTNTHYKDTPSESSELDQTPTVNVNQYDQRSDANDYSSVPESPETPNTPAALAYNAPAAPSQSPCSYSPCLGLPCCGFAPVIVTVPPLYNTLGYGTTTTPTYGSATPPIGQTCSVTSYSEAPISTYSVVPNYSANTVLGPGSRAQFVPSAQHGSHGIRTASVIYAIISPPANTLQSHTAAPPIPSGISAYVPQTSSSRYGSSAIDGGSCDRTSTYASVVGEHGGFTIPSAKGNCGGASYESIPASSPTTSSTASRAAPPAPISGQYAAPIHLTQADQPYRACPELFTDYRNSLLQHQRVPTTFVNAHFIRY